MCKCGCNTCETIRGPLLTEGRVKKLISENLSYHIDNNISLMENVFRIGSDAHLSMIKEAKKLYSRGVLDLCEEDEALMETHIGEFDLYENEIVPLDLPMLEEQMDIEDEIANEEFGMDYDQLGSNEKDWVRDEIDNMSINEAAVDYDFSKEELIRVIKQLKRGASTEVGMIKAFEKALGRELTDDEIRGFKLNEVTRYSGFNRNPEDPDSEKFEPTGSVAQFKEDLRALFGKFKGDLKNPEFIKGVAQIMVNWKPLLRSQLDEAKKKKKKEKKDPPIGKPKRGGSKAYYVYVRDPKTKKVKKVSFGSGGLRAKIRNPKARKAFAARHNCKNKKDRTKAGYWSCNLPRYASQLGLGANMNTFW